MSRVPTHTLETAPIGSRPFLEKLLRASGTGRFLKVHAQMAHSPAVLASYAALRAMIAEHGAFDPKTSAALTLAAASAIGNDYMLGISIRLAQMEGLDEAQVDALRAGRPTSDAKLNALIALVREAIANAGKVTDSTWNAALDAVWTDQQLTDAFAYLGLTLFTGYFLNFAQTEMEPSLW